MAFGDTTSRVYSFTIPEAVLDPTGFTGGSTSIGLVTQFTVVPAVTVTMVPVDIQPGTCPNPVNVDANGVLPVAIAGTATLDAAKIDPASVRLAGVAPARYGFGDEATPSEPFTGKTAATQCNDKGPDGMVDLLLKFELQDVVAAIRADLKRELVDREVLVLTLTGKMLESAGGASIEGEDVIVVLKKGKK
jgi:hypothetical protein